MRARDFLLSRAIGVWFSVTLVAARRAARSVSLIASIAVSSSWTVIRVDAVSGPRSPCSTAVAAAASAVVQLVAFRSA